MRKVVQFLAVGLVSLLPSATGFAFSDVSSDDPNLGVYEHLRDIGIMTPQGDNSFAPTRQVTRVEALTIALRSAGSGWVEVTEETPMPFIDVFVPWQQSVVLTGLQRGLVTADYPFEPNAPVTKAVFIDWLVRAHEVRTYKYSEQLATLSTDIKHDSPYGLSFAFAKVFHVVHLHPDGAFHAFDSITRSEAAQYVYRLRGVLFSDTNKREELKMRAAFHHFLSALEGGRISEAERQAIALREYARTLILTEANEDALSADAIARAVDHFVSAMRAFEYGVDSTGWAEMLLCSKQLQRAQEVKSSLSGFAAEFEQMLEQSMVQLAQG